MIITEMQMSHLRAIETAEITFRPGFNLIVGVNGVGKSTVLDALRTCLSRVLPKVADVRTKPASFEPKDIRVGAAFLEATMFLDLDGVECQYSRLEWREHVAKDDSANIDALRRKILDGDRLRDRPRNLLRALANSQSLSDSDNFAPKVSEWRHYAKGLSSAPLGIYFATTRSVLTAREAATSKSGGRISAAYADALVPRTWNIRELADWLRVQMALSSETPLAAQHMKALQDAASRFLPECTGLRPGESKGTLLIEKAGMLLDVRQLSDGERGILSIVLDIARRLSQANECMADPLGKGAAVVLIDELDLHLHPKWQRAIVENLSQAFPRCQFIATTHSPQVIAAVEPEQVLLLTGTEIIHPNRSLGMDSNWLLRHVMETGERPAIADRAVKTVEALISKGAFQKARSAMATQKKKGLDLPEWAVLEARMSRLEGLGR